MAFIHIACYFNPTFSLSKRSPTAHIDIDSAANAKKTPSSSY